MKEIHLPAGISLEEAIDLLKEEAKKTCEPCFCNFNGQKLLFTDSTDEAYIKVVGKTKADFEEEQRKWLEEYDRKEKEHQSKIPQLTEHYRKVARGLVREDQLDFWDEIVPFRLKDIYHGMELQQVLDCCKIMRDKSLTHVARLKKAYDVFMAANHSGMSAKLTMVMLGRFCPHGVELVDACLEFRFSKPEEL